MGLIASASLPFSFVEQPAFNNLMQIAAPQYKIRLLYLSLNLKHIFSGRKFFTKEMLPLLYE